MDLAPVLGTCLSPSFLRLLYKLPTLWTFTFFPNLGNKVVQKKSHKLLSQYVCIWVNKNTAVGLVVWLLATHIGHKQRKNPCWNVWGVTKQTGHAAILWGPNLKPCSVWGTKNVKSAGIYSHIRTLKSYCTSCCNSLWNSLHSFFPTVGWGSCLACISVFFAALTGLLISLFKF